MLLRKAINQAEKYPWVSLEDVEEATLTPQCGIVDSERGTQTEARMHALHRSASLYTFISAIQM